MSLIESTIGLGILAAGAYGIASMTGQQTTTIHTLEYKVKVMEVRSLLTNQIFVDPLNCACHILNANPSEFPDSGNPGRLATNQPITQIGYMKFNGSNNCNSATIPSPVLTTTKYEDNVRAGDIYVANLLPLGNGKFTANLVVELESFKKVLGNKKKILKLPMIVGTEAGGGPNMVKFTSCSMTGDVPRQIQAVLSGTTTHETRVCLRNGHMNNVVATCPAGKALIACSGGEGDIDEDHEGSWIVPDYSAGTCTLMIRSPKCVHGEPWTEQRSIAACYQI